MIILTYFFILYLKYAITLSNSYLKTTYKNNLITILIATARILSSLPITIRATQSCLRRTYKHFNNVWNK
jgi:hypothetical protein